MRAIAGKEKKCQILRVLGKKGEFQRFGEKGCETGKEGGGGGEVVPTEDNIPHHNKKKVTTTADPSQGEKF